MKRRGKKDSSSCYYKTFAISRLAAAALVVWFAVNSLPSLAADKFTLVIDAGHGGHDAGAVGAVSKEKNINLAVALLFGKYVEKNCPDVKVIYTRTTDTFVTLQGRADIANKAKADLFVSVHTNAVAKGNTVKGFEVYTLGMHRAADNLAVAKRENSVITLEDNYQSRYQGFDPNSSESYIMFEYMQDKNMENSVNFARLIEKSVCASADRINKGVHQAGFLVLRETSMPSVLVELGFISTPEEERQLNTSAVQDKIARGMLEAFQSYRSGAKEIAPAPAPATTIIADETPAAITSTQTSTGGKGPVFKVQIFVTSKSVKSGDARFKGLSSIDHYKEDGLFKYTVGASNDYNEIARLRKQILDKFPEAFIVAFKGSKRVDINQAIAEWKNSK
ncbi:MAG: N-acetylmuramoyl-L-alanine amidase [Prevotella sp.]|nr:N-acetylmuramoyl-L-alanine amidase [Prevotella sp.]